MVKKHVGKIKDLFYCYIFRTCHSSNLSHVHVRNLHPVQICTPGANLLLLSRWCKFICTRVQIVHMSAKYLISIHFDRRF